MILWENDNLQTSDMCVRGFFVGGKEKLIMDRNVQIITDLDGKKFVIIND